MSKRNENSAFPKYLQPLIPWAKYAEDAEKPAGKSATPVIADEVADAQPMLPLGELTAEEQAIEDEFEDAYEQGEVDMAGAGWITPAGAGNFMNRTPAFLVRLMSTTQLRYA